MHPFYSLKLKKNDKKKIYNNFKDIVDGIKMNKKRNTID